MNQTTTFYVKKILAFILVILALVIVYKTISFFFFEDSWTSVSVRKIIGFFWYFLVKAFIFTIPSLILPILIYMVLRYSIKNSFLFVAAGIWSVYLLYWIKGGISFLSPIASMKLAFQVYFLTILVMPQEMMTFIGAIACMIGSIVIDFFPDLPTSFDDLGAICALISMVFMYINTLATFIKKQVGERCKKFPLPASTRS